MKLHISGNSWGIAFLLFVLIGSLVPLSLSLSSLIMVSSSGAVNHSVAEDSVVFMGGFESGDFSAWTGVTTTDGESATVVTANPYDGRYHARFQVGSVESSQKKAYSYKVLSSALSEVYVRGYFYIVDGLPLDDAGDRFGLIGFEVGGSMLASFRIYRVGGVDKFNIIGYNGIGNYPTSSTDAVYPVEGRWYSIEFYAKIHSTQGEYRAWINGVEQIAITGVNSSVFGNVDKVRWGLAFSINVQHDVEVYGDSAVMSTNYIGPQILFSDGFESGDHTAWNGIYTTIGDNATVAWTNPYDGRYHGRFQTGPIGPGVKNAYYYKTLSAAPSEVYARAYFYIGDGLPLDDNNDRFGLVGFEVEGGLTATFRVYRSGGVDRFNIVGLSGTGTVQKSTDAVYLVEGQWYCLEFYIKVHSTKGEYRAWIDGVERITITNLNTMRYGAGVSQVRFGLTSTVSVQHDVEVCTDSAVISTSYVGQLRYTFGVIGPVEEIPAIRNFNWLFGNQSIRYRALMPSEITNFADVDRFDGLVVWTKPGYAYNTTAIKQFARTRIVISHVWDFSNMLYPSLKGSTQVVTTNTVTYVRDWGNFRNNDLVEMRNETGDTDQLTTVLASGLAGFGNVSQIARYDADRIAFFHMNSAMVESGFYVMDLHATTPETEWTGIWHLFPAIKMVRDFPTGKYAQWMANGQSWWDLTWVYNRIDAIVTENSDVAEKWVIGQSVEGRDIPAIVIGEGNRYAIIDGSMHGNEKIGTFASLRIAELLIEYYRSDLYWQTRLTEYKVIIIPVLNPDGFNYNSRENANDVDLNRQFPPVGTTTEPEAWALRWLMGNYTPTVYINIHEGGQWYPLDMIYGNYEEDPNRILTIDAMQQANNTFTDLRHWGWFTEEGLNVWVGTVRRIINGGINSMAVAYASSEYDTSCMLLESFLWSYRWGARKSLWGIDYYSAVIISFLQHIER